MDSLVGGVVLNVLGKVHSDPVALYLGQRREFESYGYLRSERERFARYDDVVM